MFGRLPLFRGLLYRLGSSGGCGLFLLSWFAASGIAASGSAPGSVDSTFRTQPFVPGQLYVQSLALLPNNESIVGGFSSASNPGPEFQTPLVARMHANGSVDTVFQFPPVTGSSSVQRVAVDSLGRTIAVGSWSNNLVRFLPDGSQDPTFRPAVLLGGLPTPVRSLALQPDGRILFAGNFDTVNGVPRKYVARLNPDGTTDESFQAAVDPQPWGSEPVHEVTVERDGKIIVAGNFTSVNGARRNAIARLNPDGSLDASYDPGLGLTAALDPDLSARSMVMIYALALTPEQKLYVAGSFHAFDGQLRPNLARLNPDGSLDASFGMVTLDVIPGTGAEITSLALQDNGKLLLTGIFSAVNHVPRHRIARLLPDGATDTEFVPPGDDNGYYPDAALAVQADGQILVGGSFNRLGGFDTFGLARLIGDAPGAAKLEPEITGDPLSQSVREKDSVAFKVFAKGELPFRYQWQLNQSNLPGATNESLDLPAAQISDSGEYRVIVRNAYGSALSAAAHLLVTPPEPSPGTVDLAYEPAAVDGQVLSLACDPGGRTWVTGDFVQVNGSTRRGVARLTPNGAVDTGFAPVLLQTPTAAPAKVRSVAPMTDGRIYIEGDFDRVNGSGRWSLARLHGDGALDESFVPGVATSTGWMAVQPDGKLITGQPIVRLRMDGTLDPSWHPFSGDKGGRLPVRVQGVVQQDGRVLLTLDYGLSPFPRQAEGISFTRLNPDGTLDSSYQGVTWPAALSFPSAPLLLDSGKMLFFTVGNSFSFASMPLSMFETTGEWDGAFRSGLDPLKPKALALGSEGQLFAAVDFSPGGGNASTNLLRLNPDGTVDPRFVSQAALDSPPTAMAAQPSGDLLVAVPFGTGTKIIRLTGDRVGALPSIRQQPLATAAQAERAAGLSISVAGYPVPQIQWQWNGADIVGATNAVLSWRQVELGQAGVYTAVVSNRFGQVRSAATALAVLPPSPPTILSQPISQTVVEGSIVSFSVTATNLLDLNYHWLRNGVTIPGATNSTVTLTNVLEGATLTVAVANEVGTTVSDPAHLTIFSAARTPGSVDPTFFAQSIPVLAASVYQGDYKTLIAVNSAGQVHVAAGREVVRLDSLGQRDSHFSSAPGVSDGPVVRGGLGAMLDLTSLDGVSLQRDGKVLIRGVFGSVDGKRHNQIARLNTDGSLDESFQADPGVLFYSLGFGLTGPRVWDIRELADQEILVWGGFTEISGVPRSGVAKLLQSGAVDLSFDARASLGDAGFASWRHVSAVAEDANGALVVASYLLSSNSTRVLRLNPDGSADTRFHPLDILEAGSIINSIGLEADGRLLIAGQFTKVAGYGRTNLARLNADGSFDPTYDPGLGPDGALRTVLAQPDGKAIVTGSFTSYQGVRRNQIARLNGDGTLDRSFDPGAGPDGSITTAALQSDGAVLISGSFTNVAGVLRPGVARLFGGEAPSAPAVQLRPLASTAFVGQDVNLTVFASSYVAPSYQWLFNGNPIAGATNATLLLRDADPTQAGGYTLKVSNPAGSTTTRPIELSIVPAVPPQIVTQPASALAYAGQTASFTVTAESPLPLWFQWRHDGVDLPGATNPVLRVPNLRVSDAGEYTVVVIHALQSTMSTPAVLGVDPSLSAGLPDLAFEARGWPMHSDVSTPDMKVAVDSQGRILFGSHFVNDQGALTANLIRLQTDGTFDPSFHLLADDWSRVPRDLVIQPDGKILFATGLIRLDVDGTPDPGFTPPALSGGFQQMVRSISLKADGKIVIAGDFDSADGLERNGVARLQTDGTLDLGFQPDVPVVTGPGAFRRPSAALVQPDQKVLVYYASFVPSDPSSAQFGIARYNVDGTRDTSFQSDMPLSADDYEVHMALQSDGRILVARASYTSAALLRLSPTGVVDPGFHPNFVSVDQAPVQFKALRVQSDDKIVVAGSFGLIDGVARRNLARFNADGTLDESFDPGSGSDALIMDLAIAPDGALIAAGPFTSFNGVPRPGVVRLHGQDQSGGRPQLVESEWLDGSFRFQIKTQAGKRYVPEFRDAGGTWQSMPAFTGDGQPRALTDESAVGRSRVYRVRVE